MDNEIRNTVQHNTDTFYVLCHPQKWFFVEFEEGGVRTSTEFTSEVWVEHNEERLEYMKKEHERLEGFEIVKVFEEVTVERSYAIIRGKE